MINDIQIGVRIPAELRDKIQADAVRQDRPVASVVRRILINHYSGVCNDSGSSD